MLDRVRSLDRAVTERLTISLQRQAMAKSVRKAHEDLLEAIVPAVDDANFALMTTGQLSGGKQQNELLEAMHRLLELQADINLLAGLLAEASLVSESARMKPLRDLIDAAQRRSEANLAALAKPEQSQRLENLYAKLATPASEEGIIALRSRELAAQHDAELAFAATQFEAVKLEQAVDSLVKRQDEIAQRTVADTRSRDR
jgi:hypothetical protein